MNVSEAFTGAAGHWTGIKRLRMMPGDPYSESDSEATVRPAAQGRLVTVAYSWFHEGQGQDGFLLVGDGEKPGAAVAVWCDSFGQSPQWMECHGTVDDTGAVRVEGSYPFGADTRAGWRIRMNAGRDSMLRLAMDNITPDADYQVVEAIYSRAG